MWFANPEKAIKGIYNALKSGGRLALACPATSAWSPWFGRIISKVSAFGDIKSVFSHWKSHGFSFLQKRTTRPSLKNRVQERVYRNQT